MSHGDGPPPMFEGDDFPYWIIRMESYLEACDVKCLKAMTKRFAPPAKDTALTLLEKDNEKWNAKAKTIFLDFFAKRCSTVCRTTKTPKNYESNFVRSMRDPRVSVRSDSILLWTSLTHSKCFPKKMLMKCILA